MTQYRFPGSKDPGESIDYQFDWTRRLDPDETIAAFEILPEGVTLVASARDAAGKKITFRVAGGVSGGVARFRHTITTSEGQIMIRRALLKIS